MAAESLPSCGDLQSVATTPRRTLDSTAFLHLPPPWRRDWDVAHICNQTPVLMFLSGMAKINASNQMNWTSPTLGLVQIGHTVPWWVETWKIKTGAKHASNGPNFAPKECMGVLSTMNYAQRLPRGPVSAWTHWNTSPPLVNRVHASNHLTTAWIFFLTYTTAWI